MAANLLEPAYLLEQTQVQIPPAHQTQIINNPHPPRTLSFLDLEPTTQRTSDFSFNLSRCR